MEISPEARRLYWMRRIQSLCIRHSLPRLKAGDVFVPKGQVGSVIRALGRVRRWDPRLKGWHPFSVEQPGGEVEGWIQTKGEARDGNGITDADIVFVARATPPVPAPPFQLRFASNLLDIPQPIVTDVDVADVWEQ
jgi:hypothetical protein